MRDGQSDEWGRLMAAAQDGDGAAYGRLLRELAPAIRRMVGRRWGWPEGAEDVVQEVLLTLHSVRHTYDPARPFLPWLSAIVQHRLADAARREYRRGAREVSVAEPPETFSPEPANMEVDADALRRAVAALPAGQRRAVELLKLKEMSLAEASAATGMSVGALKVAVHRAIKTLRTMLDKP